MDGMERPTGPWFWRRALTLRRIGVCAATVLLLGGSLTARGEEQTTFAVGQTGGAELKLGLGPRPVALGEAFVAKADDLNATAWNAAGLAQIHGLQVGFMHNIYLLQTSLEYLAYAQRLSPRMGLGFNLAYVNYGMLDKVEDHNGFPEVVGQFSPVTLILSGGMGYALSASLAVGGAVKLISQSIDTQSYAAVALDAGALYRPGVKGLMLGLTLQNLGTPMGHASLPLGVRAGAAYLLPLRLRPKDQWNVLADANVPFGDTRYVSGHLGTEYWYDRTLALRVGYKIKDSGSLGSPAGLTAGAGLRIALLNLDYALASFGDLGLTHQIAVTLKFSAPVKRLRRGQPRRKN